MQYTPLKCKVEVQSTAKHEWSSSKLYLSKCIQHLHCTTVFRQCSSTSNLWSIIKWYKGKSVRGSLFFITAAVNPWALSLSKTASVYERYIFNVQLILVHQFRSNFPTPYKCSYLARKLKDTRCATTTICTVNRHHTRQVIWHLSSTTRISPLSSLLSTQTAHLRLRRWTHKQNSCPCLQRVPWPLSRAYYHLLDVSATLETLLLPIRFCVSARWEPKMELLVQGVYTKPWLWAS